MTKTKTGLALVVGAAAGYVASLFLSSKTRKAHKEKVVQTVDDVFDKFMSETDKAKLYELLGKSGEEATKQAKLISKSLAKNLASAKETLALIDKDKYLTVVNQTIDDLRNKGELNQKQLSALKKYLESDFQKFVTLKKAKK